jgi:hypothetical protein
MPGARRQGISTAFATRPALPAEINSWPTALWFDTANPLLGDAGAIDVLDHEAALLRAARLPFSQPVLVRSAHDV